MTKLNISYNDNYMIHMTHESGNKGTIIVDVVSPVAVRKLEVYTEGRYLSWNEPNFLPNSMKVPNMSFCN